MSPASQAPVRQVPSSDGVSLALHDLGGDGPPVLLCHPTGFLGMTWAPLAAALAGVAHCWALDFREVDAATVLDAKGLVTDDKEQAQIEAAEFRDLVLAVVDELELTEVRAAGHSMGGAALAMAEQHRPGTFARLWLYEPIIFPPMEGVPTGDNPLAAEGVPYVIDGWELMRGPGTWEQRTNELPMQNERVRFPGN